MAYSSATDSASTLVDSVQDNAAVQIPTADVFYVATTDNRNVDDGQRPTTQPDLPNVETNKKKHPSGCKLCCRACCGETKIFIQSWWHIGIVLGCITLVAWLFKTFVIGKPYELRNN